MKRDIAIIGIAGRFPDAANIEELLVNLTNGHSSARQISDERIRRTTLPQGEEYKTGCYLEEVDLFDHQFFNISLGEAQTMDPHQRLLLEVVQETFDNAAYNGANLKEEAVSLYVAAKDLNYYMHADEDIPTLATGNGAVFIPARIARHFELKGNSALIDTSCSSSLVAVQMACNDLLLGDAEMAVACGVNLELFPFKNGPAGKLDVESPDGISRSFSASANGMAYGEVVVGILLKTLDKAIEDKDHVHAVIKGVAVNNNAHMSAGLTAPDSDAQAEAIELALKKAGISPSDIDFVEAHGSATQLGDNIEVGGLNIAFKERLIGANGKLPISSIKSNIGHSRAASGIAGLVKAVLGLKHNSIFPSLHYEKPDYINFDKSVAYVNTDLQTDEEHPYQYAGVSSIGLSGVNCHVILQKAPARISRGPSKKNFPQLLLLSSQTSQELTSSLVSLRKKLPSFQESDLPDVAHTLALGRKHFSVRQAIIGSTIEEFLSKIDEALESMASKPPQQELKKLIFLASDSDQVTPGLIDSFRDQFEDFRLAHDQIRQSASSKAFDDPAFRTFSFQYAFYQLLKQLGVETERVLGVGIGKVTASLILEEVPVAEAVQMAMDYETEIDPELDTKLRAFVSATLEEGKTGFLELAPAGLLTVKMQDFVSDFPELRVLFPEGKNASVAHVTLLKKLYEAGFPFDLAVAFNDPDARKVELPAYQFQPTRCWIRESPKNYHPGKVATEEEVIHLADKNASGIEQEIAGFFHEILDESSFSVDSDFFELGGDSLRCTKLVRKIEEKYAISLDFEDIFDFPTISGLAEYIESQWSTEHRVIGYWEAVLKNGNITADDNFFLLGGHSLNANQVINRIKKDFEIGLDFEDFYAYPTVKELAAFIDRSLTSKDKRYDLPQIVPIPEEEYYDVSPAQKRLWIACQFKEASIAYNQPGSYYFAGDFDRTTFDKALFLLIERHESLRTCFIKVGDEPKQLIIPADKVEFHTGYVDLTDWPDPEVELVRLMNESNQGLFDLEKAPLMRVKIVKLKDNLHLLLYNLHHIIFDGWSTSVFLNDLEVLYNAVAQKACSPLKPLTIHYKDYAAWKNKTLAIDALPQKQFWLDQFSGELPVLNLHSDYPRPTYRSWNGEITKTVLDNTLTQSLYKLCEDLGISLFMLLQGSVTLLMHKYSGQDDIIIGAPVSGRNHEALENQIGIFVNNLTYRSRFSTEDTVEEFLSMVKENTLQAFKHQEYPFDQLLEDLNLKRDLSRSPLFDVGIVLHNIHDQGKTENFSDIDGVSAGEVDAGKRISLLDLRIQFLELKDGIECSIEYNKDLYTHARAIDMLSHYTELLQSIVSDRKTPIRLLNYLSNEEKHELLYGFNRNQKGNQADKGLIGFFQDHVKDNPESPALVSPGMQMTYRQLDEKSNELAHELIQQYDISPGAVIAVMTTSSHHAIVAILAIMKAGATYLPVVTNLPQDRRRFMLEDTGASLILTDSEFLFDLDYFKGGIFALDIQLEGLEQPNTPVGRKIAPDQISYIIYTSGSTGTPKGVPIKYESIEDRVIYCSEYLGVKNTDRMLQFASLGFDASIYEILMSLIRGACLVLPGLNDKNNVNDIIQLIEQYQVSVVTLPPAYLKLMNRHPLPSVKKMISTGEAAILEDALYYAGMKEYYNGYGPTETCIGASFYQVDTANMEYYRKLGSIPIGSPFANTTIYVLDDDLKPVSKGNPGQIYVAGKGLSPGYLNNPALTAEKFINNPYSKDESSVMYKTGDIGRWNHQENLEYLGRSDNQVQINGIRVELEEISSAIHRHLDVQKAAVVLKDEEVVAFVEEKKKMKLFPDVNIAYIYDDLMYHSMGQDDIRIEAFRKAFRRSVKGKTAMDVGTGNEALLARIALEEGASKVYAIEVSKESFEKAQKKVKELGLEDRIILVYGDIRDIELPEKVDYCFSDIAGNIGGAGGAGVLVEAAKKFLKDEKNVFPKTYSTSVAAISLNDQNVDFELTELAAQYTKKTFEEIGYKFDLRLCLQNFTHDSIISDSDEFEKLVFSETVVDEESHQIQLNFEKDGVFNGFVLGLTVEVDDGILIDNQAEGKIVLPLYIPAFEPGVSVKQGDRFTATVSRRLSDNQLQPDYEIDGKLVRRGHDDLPFRYTSYNHKEVLCNHPFYQRVFPEGEIKIKEALSTSGIIEKLRKDLPSFMVPNRINVLEDIPLSKNGKVDVEALKKRDDDTELRQEYVAPRNDFESSLKEIWEKVLNKEKLGIFENFFDLGANSIKVINALTMIDEKYPKAFDITEIFSHPSINEMAKLFQQRQSVTQDKVKMEDLDF